MRDTTSHDNAPIDPMLAATQDHAQLLELRARFAALQTVDDFERERLAMLELVDEMIARARERDEGGGDVHA